MLLLTLSLVSFNVVFLPVATFCLPLIFCLFFYRCLIMVYLTTFIHQFHEFRLQLPARHHCLFAWSFFHVLRALHFTATAFLFTLLFCSCRYVSLYASLHPCLLHAFLSSHFCWHLLCAHYSCFKLSADVVNLFVYAPRCCTLTFHPSYIHALLHSFYFHFFFA